ncbi:MULTISPECIES: hypothetical protein [Dermacoccus]|nr:hypothetical protein [Dermacoccus nishinomiyaensis]
MADTTTRAARRKKVQPAVSERPVRSASQRCRQHVFDASGDLTWYGSVVP